MRVENRGLLAFRKDSRVKGNRRKTLENRDISLPPIVHPPPKFNHNTYNS
jgi:hypothetical protein